MFSNTFTFSRLYKLSGPKKETRQYTEESAGIFYPCTSPGGAGFFFVQKKDKTLPSCMD